ncbi:MAG: glycosyltransferase [Mycobacteriales bacterium]
MTTAARPVAVVAGYLVRFPVGGMTWVFRNWMRGLADVGFEPVFMEAAGPQPSCYDVEAARMTDDPGYGSRYAAEVLAGTRWWYADPSLPSGGVGMSYDEAVATLEGAALLVNVGGSCWAPEFAKAARRILVDADAPFSQLRLADGDEEWTSFVDQHDTLATYAVHVADGTAVTPAGGRRWLATRPPVHLPSVTVTPVPAGPWTTVTSWSAYGAAWWELEEYRQKDAEYMRLGKLPSLLDGVTLELAMSGEGPKRQLTKYGWRVIDPIPVSRTPEAFCDYVRASRGELGVAKQAYVKARTGAFNDRTLMYAASGRPVVCSDTGLDWLPTGEGVLPFSDIPSAVAAIRAVEEDPQAHGSASRRLAEQHFAADRVVGDLLRAADVPLP